MRYWPDHDPGSKGVRVVPAISPSVLVCRALPSFSTSGRWVLHRKFVPMAQDIKTTPLVILSAAS